MITLLDQADSTGEGQTIWRQDQVEGLLMVHGTFDGATATVEVYSEAYDTWVPVSDGVFTEPEAAFLDLPSTATVRGAVSDAGASTAISMEVL